MGHSPTHEELLALARGELAGSEGEALRALVSADPLAAKQLALLMEIRDAVREEPVVRPSRELLDRLKALMPEAGRSAAASMEELVREVGRAIGRLVFDSATPEGALGFRGGAGKRHLRYEFGESNPGDLDLMLTMSPTGVVVTGQLDGPSAEEASIVEARDANGAVVGVSTVDASGVFSLTLPPGVYQIRVGRLWCVPDASIET